jgi:hypothetical protein
VKIANKAGFGGPRIVWLHGKQMENELSARYHSSVSCRITSLQLYSLPDYTSGIRPGTVDT